MSDQNNTQPKQVKTVGALICGILGFVFGIPATICTYLCNSAGSALGATGAGSTVLIILFAICWIAGFILCFYSKDAKSKQTGSLTLICGIVMAIAIFMFFKEVNAFSLMGAGAGVLYVISGFLAIGNASKPAA